MEPTAISLTTDITMTETTHIPPPALSNSKKRKNRPSQSHEIKSFTLKSPPYSYIHLTLLTSSTQTSATPDILTYRTYLARALTQFLGLHGSCIPIDILKIGSISWGNEGKGGEEGMREKEERDLWIRVPREDCSAVVAAVTGWSATISEEEIAWRVKGRGEWLGRVLAEENVIRVWGD